MKYQSNWFSLKMFMVTLVSLYLLLAISGSMAYMGTRYGKREFDRLQARSIAQRSIANRGARFYPGSRYGGKRSYWQPTFVPSDSEVGSADSPNVGNVPYDCIHIPFVGVRCSRPEDANYWNNDDESTGNIGEGNPSSSSVVSSVMPEQP